MNMQSLSDWANEENEILSELSHEETLAQMNQMDKVKHLLLNNVNGVCHNTFMEHYIPRFGALIWTLRHEEDWLIEKERCDLHDYHKSLQYKYIYNGRSI
jgi:hypothetical protein